MSIALKKHNPFKKTFQKIQRDLLSSYKKLRKDLKKHVPSSVIKNDYKKLLLVLGEGKFLINECKKIAKKIQKKR